jgi:hypothetical protein
MRREHWIKEEISVYFRMVFRKGVAGKERPRMDGKRKTPGTMGGCSAGRAQILPEKYGNVYLNI